MATQQLPTALPPGWESDYDGASERWFFIHRPTGFRQFFFPKVGDEHTRVAELAQPQPTNGTNGSLTSKMEAMTISVKAITASPIQQPQQQAPPPQSTPAPQSPGLQQNAQGSPLSRTVSQTLQRKAIPRRDSVQSQVSTHSGQSAHAAPQPAQQYQQFNSQSTSQVVQNVQYTQQAQQYHPSQQVLQNGQMQQGQPIQQAQPAQQYVQNQQPLQMQQPQQVRQNGQLQQGQPIQQAQPAQQYVQNQQPVQIQQPQQNPQFVKAQQPIQTQQPQQYQQFIANGQVQYQQAQPFQTPTGQHSQIQVPQSPAQSPLSTLNQTTQHGGYFQQTQSLQQSQLAQHQNTKTQPLQQTQQAQDMTAHTQTPVAHQNAANNQRRFSIIPVVHQPNTGQVINSPSPVQQQPQGTRHSSIPLNNFQTQQALPQGQQPQQSPLQPVQNGQVPLTYAPQMSQQINTQPQQPAPQYVQQINAAAPPNLPPPAPGMQWVLVQPGSQPVQNGQQTFDPNKSSSFSVQTQQLQGGVPITGRPGLVNRMSSSTVSSSKKAFEASKGFVKKHPGKTMAIVGSLGLVAEACGVNVISDAVAGSKVYANVQNAKNRKKLQNSAQKPTAQQAQGVVQASNIVPNGYVNGVQHMVQQVGQQLPQVLHQQNQAGYVPVLVNGNTTTYSIAQPGLMNQQHTFIPQVPVQHVVHQQPSHQHFIPQQHHHNHQLPSQQFNSQQNGQFFDLSNQFNQNQNPQQPYIQQNPPMQQNVQSGDPTVQIVQGQNGQPQYIIQQNPPVQYYQPTDNSQQQFQQQNPSLVYVSQEGQNNQQQSSGGLANFASDAYNMLPNGQGNSQSQSQSPSLMSADDQASQQQQLPSTPASPFDGSSQGQQFPDTSSSPFDPSQQFSQNPGVSTSPFDPSQVQQFPVPSSSPFDPSSQQSQQIPGLSTSSFDPSSPVMFTPDMTGQSQMNASNQDDNSYINAPPSPGLATYNDMAAVGQDDSLSLIDDQSAVDDANSLAQADDDMDAAIF